LRLYHSGVVCVEADVEEKKSQSANPETLPKEEEAGGKIVSLVESGIFCMFILLERR
jgi:hypothetical protein